MAISKSLIKETRGPWAILLTRKAIASLHPMMLCAKELNSKVEISTLFHSKEKIFIKSSGEEDSLNSSITLGNQGINFL